MANAGYKSRPGRFSQLAGPTAPEIQIDPTVPRGVVAPAVGATLPLSMKDLSFCRAEQIWFRVVHSPYVVVRDGRNRAAHIIATAKVDEIIEASRIEDGWARLSHRETRRRSLAIDSEGWVMIDGASVGLGALLTPCLPRWFRVVFLPRIMLRSQANQEGEMVGAIDSGKIFEVMAMQNDFVRLTDLEKTRLTLDSAGEGWAKIDGTAKGLGVLLEPVFSAHGDWLAEIDSEGRVRGGRECVEERRPKAQTQPKDCGEAYEGPAPCKELLCLITESSDWAPEKLEMRFRQVWSEPSCGLVRHEFCMRLGEILETEDAHLTEDAISKLPYAMINFQILSFSKTWNWRIIPKNLQEKTIIGPWGKNNLLVPDLSKAVEAAIGDKSVDDRSFCIVEPLGSTIVICVELTAAEKSGYCKAVEEGQQEYEDVQVAVWYEMCEAEDPEIAFVGSDTTIPSKLLVGQASRLRW